MIGMAESTRFITSLLLGFWVAFSKIVKFLTECLEHDARLVAARSLARSLPTLLPTQTIT